jgi:hypothetical protein
MRKRFKNKLRSCAMCKPHKTKGSCRWKYKELASLNEFEKEKRDKEGKILPQENIR